MMYRTQFKESILQVYRKQKIRFELCFHVKTPDYMTMISKAYYEGATKKIILPAECDIRKQTLLRARTFLA